MAIERSSLEFFIKTTADTSGAKEAADALSNLNKAVAEGLALPINQELSAEQDALNDLANAAAAAGESVEKFVEQKKRATETSLKNAFDPGAGLGTGAPDLSALADPAFKVETLEQVEAIEQSIASLQRRIAVTQAAGESVAEYQVLLEKLNETLATEEAQNLITARSQEELSAAQKKDEVKQQREEVKKLTEQKKDWRAVLQGLAVDIPGVSQLLRAMSNPLAAAGVGVGFLTTRFQKLWEELNRPGPSAAQWKSLEEAVAKVQETVNAAAVDAAAYARSLEAIASAQDSITAATDKSIAKLREESRARLEIQSAEAALKTARIDAAEKSGSVKPEDAIQARAKIASDLEAAKVKEANDLQNAEIEKKNAALQQADAKALELKAKREAAEADAAPVITRETENATRVKNAESNIQAEKSKRAALEKQLAEEEAKFKLITDPVKTGQNFLFPGLGDLTADQTRTENRLRKEIEASRKFEAEQKAIADSAQKTAVERADELKRKQEAVAKAKAEELANAKDAEKLRGELPELTTKAAIEQPARNKVLELQNQTRSVQTQSAAEAARKQAAQEKAEQEERARRKANEDIQRGGRTGTPSAPTGDLAQAGENFQNATGDVAAAVDNFGNIVVESQRGLASVVNAKFAAMQREIDLINRRAKNRG